MCLSIPYKVIDTSSDQIILKSPFIEKKEVEKWLVDCEKGDYVFVQQDTIIKKIPQSEAKQTLALLNN